MFDIAYETEASIVATEIEREKIFYELLDIRIYLSRPTYGFYKSMEFARLSSMHTYWSIMYETHGV